MPSCVTAWAALATHWPTSIMYGATNPWSRAAVLDLYKYSILYNLSYTSTAAWHQAILDGYQGSSIPKLVCYEGGLQTNTPIGVETGPDPAGYYLRGALSADLSYDPAYYYAETATSLLTQQAGASFICNFTTGIQFYNTGDYDGNGCYVWSYQNYQNQPFGMGDGTIASSGVPITNQYWTNNQLSNHANNATVRLKAWNDWTDSVSPFVIPGDVYVTPANGATGVSQRAVIVVEFDEPMLGASITNSTFTVKVGGTPISGIIAYNPITWTATFTPVGATHHVRWLHRPAHDRGPECPGGRITEADHVDVHDGRGPDRRDHVVVPGIEQNSAGRALTWHVIGMSATRSRPLCRKPTRSIAFGFGACPKTTGRVRPASLPPRSSRSSSDQTIAGTMRPEEDSW